MTRNRLSRNLDDEEWILIFDPVTMTDFVGYDLESRSSNIIPLKNYRDCGRAQIRINVPRMVM
jgi:hypothetical protein